MSDTSAWPEGLPAYIAVTAAYQTFMLTDGALRILVLLHFHTLGFSLVQLAYLFVLYEIAGVVTNLCPEWIAARLGLTSTLYAGLGLQVLALLAMAQLDPTVVVGASVVYVMLLQGASGKAKDLAKMSSKSAVKLLVPSGEGGLFRWVAVLIAMPAGLPKGRKGAKFSEVFSKSANVNWLSVARAFVFGARDVWFPVGIPIYFQAVLSAGRNAGNRTAFFLIGTFMALWVILYGLIQANAPRILRASTRPTDELIKAASGWAWSLAAVPSIFIGIAIIAGAPQLWLTISHVARLLIFGVVFAVNSSLHSYLILSFSKAERVTMDLGFNYMAHAAGRLAGTLFSGLTYQIGGLPLMLGAAAFMVALSAMMVGLLKSEHQQPS